MTGKEIECGRIGLHLDQYYWGFYFLPEYRSPDRSIWAYIKQTEEEMALTTNGISLATLPVGGKYLDIHFVPDDLPDTKDPADAANVRHILRVGFPAYLHFLTSLASNKILKDVDVVIGTTWPRMARFAIRHLGFSPLDAFVRDDEDIFKTAKALKNGVEKPPVNIGATKQQLLAKETTLSALRKKWRI